MHATGPARFLATVSRHRELSHEDLQLLEASLYHICLSALLHVNKLRQATGAQQVHLCFGAAGGQLQSPKVSERARNLALSKSLRSLTEGRHGQG